MSAIDLGSTPFSPLASHLLDLLHALDGKEIPLILVGGFGLYLRRRLVETEGLTTLYDTLPEPRATEDFDLALQLQLLSDVAKMRGLREALDGLGYQVVQIYARKHAFDLYTLTALLTLEEYETLSVYRERYGSHSIGGEAAEIVRQFFGERDAPGALRLQEHANFPQEYRLEDFLALLKEVFN